MPAATPAPAKRDEHIADLAGEAAAGANIRAELMNNQDLWAVFSLMSDVMARHLTFILHQIAFDFGLLIPMSQHVISIQSRKIIAIYAPSAKRKDLKFLDCSHDRLQSHFFWYRVCILQ